MSKTYDRVSAHILESRRDVLQRQADHTAKCVEAAQECLRRVLEELKECDTLETYAEREKCKENVLNSLPSLPSERL